MIQGYYKLRERINELFPVEAPYKVGPASVDVRIGDWLIFENGYQYDLRHCSEEKPYWMTPGQFLLAEMYEETCIPLDLTAEFILKSSLARAGYDHSLAGLVDPGWRGRLTLELKNKYQIKSIPLWPLMPIGQLVYHKTEGARPYAGRYQGDTSVSPARKEVW